MDALIRVDTKKRTATSADQRVRQKSCTRGRTRHHSHRRRRHIPKLGMVLMVATLLHSVAVGNLLPSHVKTICVDINPASVTKLMNRGRTSQEIGMVSDAGTFMPLLLAELRERSEKKC